MIYALGIQSDATLRHFVDLARHRGHSVTFVDLRAVAREGQWKLGISPSDESFLAFNDQRILLDPRASYYVRLIDLTPVQNSMELARRWAGLLEGLNAWLEMVPGTVVNRPGHAADNLCKPLHEILLARHGLRVPESITSANNADLVQFCEAGPTIVKSVSGQPARAQRVSASDLQDYDARRGPLHLQRLIDGFDVRAHVVGDKIHAEKIVSSEVDYREETAQTNCQPYVLPDALRFPIKSFMQASGLILSGWDFKVDSNNVHWCLEANPMPGYGGYDVRLGGAITDSILTILKNESTRNA